MSRGGLEDGGEPEVPPSQSDGVWRHHWSRWTQEHVARFGSSAPVVDELFMAGGMPRSGGCFWWSGFRRKEFRGKLAIAITANFKNRNTSAEAKVEEISGVAFIFNQKFFQELRQETGSSSPTAAITDTWSGVQSNINTWLQVLTLRTSCTTRTTLTTLLWRQRNRVCWTKESFYR